MTLSKKELDIIACMAFDASMSVQRVSAETGLKEHVVRHALNRLVDDGIVRMRPYVSPYALGFMEFHAEIVVETPGQAALNSLISAIVESPASTFAREVAGDYHLSIMFLARSLVGVSEFFDKICAKIPDIKFRKSVSGVISVIVSYPKLDVGSTKNNSISYYASDKVQKYDELDEKLLVLLGSGTFSSRRQLSAECGVAQSTIDYRIQGLQQRGILLAVGYSIPTHSDGLSPYALRITASNPCADLRNRLENLSRNHIAVRSLLHLAGDFDYLLGVRLSHPSLISAFTQELRSHLEPYVSKVEVLPELRTHKTYVNPEDLDVLRKLTA